MIKHHANLRLLLLIKRFLRETVDAWQCKKPVIGYTHVGSERIPSYHIISSFMPAVLPAWYVCYCDITFLL